MKPVATLVLVGAASLGLVAVVATIDFLGDAWGLSPFPVVAILFAVGCATVWALRQFDHA